MHYSGLTYRPPYEELLIEKLEAGLERFPSWQLDSVPNKAAEGRIIV